MFKYTLLASACFALSACEATTEQTKMIQAKHMKMTHADHNHVHAAECGHTAVKHQDHMVYLHDNHMHHAHMGHTDEHVVKVTEANPNAEIPADASKHEDHQHGEGDTLHAMVPHGDHMDFLHNGHLHHVHEGHVDEHGSLEG